jgi:hypothetical protein
VFSLEATQEGRAPLGGGARARHGGMSCGVPASQDWSGWSPLLLNAGFSPDELSLISVRNNEWLWKCNASCIESQQGGGSDLIGLCPSNMRCTGGLQSQADSVYAHAKGLPLPPLLVPQECPVAPSPAPCGNGKVVKAPFRRMLKCSIAQLGCAIYGTNTPSCGMVDGKDSCNMRLDAILKVVRENTRDGYFQLGRYSMSTGAGLPQDPINLTLGNVQQHSNTYRTP